MPAGALLIPAGLIPAGPHQSHLMSTSVGTDIVTNKSFIWDTEYD